ncbi:MAG: hypothetical protein M0R80_27725 [Proteobacteria bacterium]|jgi:hypothetical protein|nr:hypothetical protein [Pseudomonadota bacterium]
MEIKTIGNTVARQSKATVIVALSLVMIAGGLDLVGYINLPEIGKMICGGVIGVYAIADLIKGQK